MSRLEELIEKLCPDGVEYKPLWNLTIWDKKFNSVEKSKQPVINSHHYLLAADLKALEVENGNVKLLTTSPSELYTSEELAGNAIKDGEIISIPWGGNPVVQYYKGKYVTADNRIATSKDTNILDNKFLYYFLTNKQEEIASFYRGSGIKHPDMSKVLELSIPVPPLEVQREIVRVLDSFTLLTAELTAELTARKEQYDYYKELTFENVDSYSHATTKDVTKDRFWLMPATPNYIDKGIPYITSKNVRNGVIDFTDVKYISKEDYESISKNRSIETNDLLITMIGTIGETAFVGSYTEFYGQNIYLVRFDETKCLGRYFYHYLSSKKIKDSLISKKNPSSQGYIKAGSIDNLEFPLPPIEKQKEIVDTLDYFESLCSDISAGLPAEIEARQKQYEYYRDKLLTFKEKN